MRHIYAAILLPVTAALVLSIEGCPGERDNPLDPEDLKGHDPFAISVDTTSAGIAVTWHKVSGSGVKGYRIYRSEADTGQDVVAGNVSADLSTYSDREVWAGRTYYYRVCAVGSRGEESIRSAYDGIQARGAVLNVSPDSVAAPAAGGFNRTIRVQNGTGGSRFDWSASTPAGSASWIALSRLSGAAPDSFQIQVTTENSTSQLRQGIVIVSAPGAAGSPDTITVTQYPAGTQPTLVISPDSVRLPGMGGTSGQIQITMANVINPAYSVASSDTSWLKVSKRSGTTPDFFTVTAQDNFTETSRHGVVITLGNDCNPETLKVYQPGMAWEPLASGLGGPGQFVHALAVFGSDLVAGGGFYSAGGLAAWYAARWDSVQWHAIDGVLSDIVDALCVYDSELIEGGWGDPFFVHPHCIARWNGTRWDSLSSGVNYNVRSLAVFTEDLIVGGHFSDAGGIAVRNIARWDGAWHSIERGISPANATVYSLAVWNGTLVVGGSFDTAGYRQASNIARWDGNSWLTMGAGMNGTVLCLISHTDTLIAGGSFTSAGGVPVGGITRWDGTTWQRIGDGFSGQVHALSSFKGRLIAGGSFQVADGSTANGVAFWNGESWRSLGSGANGAVMALAVYRDGLVVAGQFTMAGGVAANNIAILKEQD